MLRIELDTDSLQEAVKNHLATLGLNLEGKKIEVRIIAGRSKGSTAEALVSDAPVADTQYPNHVPEGDAHLQDELPEVDTAQPEEEEVISKPSFGKKKA